MGAVLFSFIKQGRNVKEILSVLNDYLSKANERDVMSPGDLQTRLKLEPGNGRCGRTFSQTPSGS